MEKTLPLQSYTDKEAFAALKPKPTWYLVSVLEDAAGQESPQVFRHI